MTIKTTLTQEQKDHIVDFFENYDYESEFCGDDIIEAFGSFAVDNSDLEKYKIGYDREKECYVVKELGLHLHTSYANCDNCFAVDLAEYLEKDLYQQFNLEFQVISNRVNRWQDYSDTIVLGNTWNDLEFLEKINKLPQIAKKFIK